MNSEGGICTRTELIPHDFKSCPAADYGTSPNIFLL